jgi:hypothetical protein
MDVLKVRLTDWSKITRWACQGALKDSSKSEEEFVLDSINECRSRNQVRPKIPSCANAMNDVDLHFKKMGVVDVATLDLYQSILKVSKTELLAFLLSCAEGNVEEVFVEMPTSMISEMKGKPCRTRDLEVMPPQTLAVKQFSKTPSVLISDKEKVRLYVRGSEVAAINGTGFLVPIPTSSTLEQLVLVVSTLGECKLISTTRQNIEIIGEFSIDVEEKLDWVDIITTKNHVILYWGGTDPLRGQNTWNFYSGINLKSLNSLKEELFYDVPNAVSISDSILESAQKQHDFTTHGNLLTLWTRHFDSEHDGIRYWESNQMAVFGSFYLSAPIKLAVDVWGSPQQFISLHDGCVKTWICGEHRSTFDVVSGAANVCVLYAHSR